MMTAGVSSYSFNRRIQKGEMTQFDCVKAAKELGFSTIEFIDLFRKPGEWLPSEEQAVLAKEIREEADRLGMEIAAYTIGANLYQETDEASEKEVARLCRQLEIAKLLGAKVMRHDACWSLPKKSPRSFDAMLPVIAENARKVATYAEKLGIRTCVENHGFIAQDSDRMERLYNAVAHENFGLLIDVGNFFCADEDSRVAVSRLAPYAIHVHVKDFHRYMFGDPSESLPGTFYSRGMNRLAGCAVGEGDVPVHHCLAILKHAGYNGVVSVEYEGAEDSLLGIKKGKENLDRFLLSI